MRENYKLTVRPKLIKRSNSDKMEIVNINLSYLEKGVSEEIYANLYGLEILVRSLHDLRVADVLTRSAFESAQITRYTTALVVQRLCTTKL